jgi:tetratricopeptide (TPR) repeat protein
LKDLAIACNMLAGAKEGAEKAQCCRRAISILSELLKIFPQKENPPEHAELLTMIWSSYTSLAEVENKADNCLLAAEVCEKAIEIYKDESPGECADCQKNLGYTYVTLAEAQDKAVNCRRAILSYKAALETFTQETSLSDYADIQRDLGYTYLILAEEDRDEIACRKAIRAYRKAAHAYSELHCEFEKDDPDPLAEEIRFRAERCRWAQDACKARLKILKKLNTPEITLAGKSLRIRRRRRVIERG